MMRCETSPKVRDSHYDLDKNRFGGMARVRPGLNGSVKECKVEMEKC